MLYSTCFDHPSVHSKEELYMQFYDTSSWVNICRQIDVRMTSNITWHRLDCLYGCMKVYH